MSIVNEAFKMATENEDTDLKERYNEGWELFREIEDSDDSTSSKNIQVEFP